MDKIAYLVKNYLNRTETFIYEPLRNIRDFEVLVLTNSTRNLDEFPCRSVYSESRLSGVERLKESVCKNFGGSYYFPKIIRENRVKLFHAHFATEAIERLYLKKKCNLPFVVSLYGFDVYLSIKDPAFMQKLRHLFREADLFLAYSERMRGHVVGLGCPEEKIRTHRGGADLSKFHFAPRQITAGKRINILIVARFVEKKGIEYGIKGFAMIADKFPDAVLNIVGEGPLRSEMEALISGLGLGAKVNLLGSKSHAEYIVELEKALVLLAPSVAARSGDEEGGINAAVIEAMATGLPVIATSHAGSELVFDGRTGYLAKERDAADLASKIDILLSEPGRSPYFGEQARKLIEGEFDMVKQTRKLESIYGEMISSYGG